MFLTNLRVAGIALKLIYKDLLIFMYICKVFPGATRCYVPGQIFPALFTISNIVKIWL